MTEYLILSLSRAVALTWEYNREVTVNIMLTRNYGDIPKSHLNRVAGSGSDIGFGLDSTSKRIFRAFGTPPKPSIAGVTDATRPRLLFTTFMLAYWTGSPAFRIDLHLANSDGTPGQLITSFTPAVVDHGYNVRSVYVDLRPSGYELDWDKLYSIALVPTTADGSNHGTAYAGTPSGDALVMKRIGYSSDNGATWTLADNKDWRSNQEGYSTIIYRYNYISDVVIPVARSREAFRSYFNGWPSRTTLPSGFTVVQESIIGITDPATGVEIPLVDSCTHSVTFYTTANIAAFTQSDTASFKWKYDVNPVTVDMFYASEAYLQSIEFLWSSSTTSSVRLNDSYEQEFGGSGLVRQIRSSRALVEGAGPFREREAQGAGV